MRESRGATKPRGAMKVKAGPIRPRWDAARFGARSHHRPVSTAASVRRSKSVHVGTRKMVNYAWIG